MIGDISSHTVRTFDQELDRLTRMIAQMGGFAETQVRDAVEALMTRDASAAEMIIARDREVDALEERIDQFAIRLLATRQPVAVDLRTIAMALKITNDLERISDYAVSIAKRVRKLADLPHIRPLYTVPRMGEVAHDMVRDVLDAYIERDYNKAVAVWHRDSEVDDLYDGMVRELITYMLEDVRHIAACIELQFVAKNIERIGDHATNIAEKVKYMINGEEINPRRHRLEF